MMCEFCNKEFAGSTCDSSDCIRARQLLAPTNSKLATDETKHGSPTNEINTPPLQVGEVKKLSANDDRPDIVIPNYKRRFFDLACPTCNLFQTFHSMSRYVRCHSCGKKFVNPQIPTAGHLRLLKLYFVYPTKKSVDDKEAAP